MPYVLKHHFDPDFDHTHLKPKEGDDGRVDHYNLGYAQNVSQGSLLAEWEECASAEAAGVDPRFVHQSKIFPAGQGCAPHPKDPDKLVATDEGYVFYFRDKIHVKSILNVRSDVNYNTGNISFLGDVVVHGSIRAGFGVQGRDVHVRDVVEAARVQAKNTLRTEAGIKGGGKAWLSAGGNMRLPFCEGARLQTGGNLVVDHSVLHSQLFVGENLAVGAKLIGGITTCRGMVYVKECLGGGLGETQLVLGYDPAKLLEDTQLTSRIYKLEEQLQALKRNKNKGEKLSKADRTKMDALSVELKTLHRKHRALWEQVHTRQELSNCRVVVPGEVRPGVEISIGDNFFVNQDYLRDVVFYREGYEIKIASPAMSNEGIG